MSYLLDSSIASSLVGGTRSPSRMPTLLEQQGVEEGVRGDGMSLVMRAQSARFQQEIRSHAVQFTTANNTAASSENATGTVVTPSTDRANLEKLAFQRGEKSGWGVAPSASAGAPPRSNSEGPRSRAGTQDSNITTLVGTMVSDGAPSSPGGAPQRGRRLSLNGHPLELDQVLPKAQSNLAVLSPQLRETVMQPVTLKEEKYEEVIVLNGSVKSLSRSQSPVGNQQLLDASTTSLMSSFNKEAVRYPKKPCLSPKALIDENNVEEHNNRARNIRVRVEIANKRGTSVDDKEHVAAKMQSAFRQGSPKLRELSCDRGTLASAVHTSLSTPLTVDLPQRMDNFRSAVKQGLQSIAARSGLAAYTGGASSAARLPQNNYQNNSPENDDDDLEDDDQDMEIDGANTANNVNIAPAAPVMNAATGTTIQQPNRMLSFQQLPMPLGGAPGGGLNTGGASACSPLLKFQPFQIGFPRMQFSAAQVRSSSPAAAQQPGRLQIPMLPALPQLVLTSHVQGGVHSRLALSHHLQHGNQMKQQARKPEEQDPPLECSSPSIPAEISQVDEIEKEEVQVQEVEESPGNQQSSPKQFFRAGPQSSEELAPMGAVKEEVLADRKEQEEKAVEEEKKVPQNNGPIKKIAESVKGALVGTPFEMKEGDKKAEQAGAKKAE